MNAILRHDQQKGKGVLRPEAEVNTTFKANTQNPVSASLVL